MSGGETGEARRQAADTREARLKAALKANMARRKSQARARAEAEQQADGEPPEQRG